MKEQATQDAVTTAPQATPRYADYLAQLRAKSVGAGIVAAGLLVAGGLLADAVDANAAMVPFVALALVLAVYGVYLWAHVDAVTRDLWQREIAKGEDIDGDGNVGPPRRSVRYGSPGATHGWWNPARSPLQKTRSTKSPSIGPAGTWTGRSTWRSPATQGCSARASWW